MIETGGKAPDFTLPAVPGGSLTLSVLRPRAVVLFFYPRDNTPACTDEAVAFSARASLFREAGAELVGISKDSLKKHQNFAAKFSFDLILASDADGDTCERYGVWQEKKMYGRSYMGIVRSTVLIGGDGVVRRVWSPVKVEGHADEVLEAVRGL